MTVTGTCSGMSVNPGCLAVAGNTGSHAELVLGARNLQAEEKFAFLGRFSITVNSSSHFLTSGQRAADRLGTLALCQPEVVHVWESVQGVNPPYHSW